MNALPRPTIPAALIGLALLAGCGDGDEITVYTAPKEAAPTTMASAQLPAEADSHAHGGGDLHWTAPPEWKQQQVPPGGMRVAAFTVSENPKVELTVIPLSGAAGALLPNVNRWEGQLGLPPSPQEKLERVVKSMPVGPLDVKRVDLTGPESQQPRQRMLAAVVPAGGKSWFFKMSGPADVIAAQEKNFDALINSLHGHAPGETHADAAPPAAGAQPGAATEPPASAPSPVKLSKFQAPPDWKELPNQPPPRVMAFQVGAPEQKADLIVSKFPNSGAGSFEDNITRWRGQIGLPPMEDPRSLPMTSLTVGQGNDGVLLEFHNPEAAKRMYVVISSAGGELWFFKLTGPADAIAAQKPALDAFVKSLEFAPAN
ncbi:MAG TPA: hypothetical protein VER17_17945 [Tepidisphaeraceae bacterium]|nr:hypothetical protein [Tepidisphaeraceae bacterium]